MGPTPKSGPPHFFARPPLRPTARASFSKKMSDTEIFLTERLARPYVAVAESKARWSNLPLRSPTLQTVKISQS